MRPPLVRPALFTAVFVGTVLTCVNQWPQVIGGPWDVGLLGHAAVNVLIPFVVSLFSRWRTVREMDAVRDRR